MLQDLIISRCRIKILENFCQQPKELFYIRQLVRLTGEEINAVRRELTHLENANIVKKEHRGNRIYYWPNDHHPLYGDILSLFSKNVGLGGLIVQNKSKLGEIKIAILSGRYARGLPTKEGKVDLLLVGNISLNHLSELIREEEKKLGREINYTVMTKEELEFRRKRHDPFLLGILQEPRIILLGDEMELVG